MPENHYVQIIHGTWNPPSTREPQWYQAGSTDPENFSNRLNRLLGEFGMPNAVWRKSVEDVGFGWSGANQHEDRIEAGDRLFQSWIDLLKHDPAARIHIVAHSHGANVTLRALQRYLEYLEQQAEEVYNRALIGCQYVEPREAISIAIAQTFGEQAPIIGEQTRNILDDLSYLRNLGRHLRGSTSRPSDWPHKIGHRDQMWSEKHVWKRFRRHVWLEFRNAWVGSRRTNRIGALVFLGAPFLRKVWERRTSWWLPGNIIRLIMDAVVTFSVAFILTYIVGLIVWGITWVLLSPIFLILGYGRFYDPVLNPIAWPELIRDLLKLSTVILGGFLLFAWQTETQKGKNLYFDEERFRDHRAYIEGDNVPFDTLVVHADMLDEVILGFSTEPLVYGAIRSQLHSFVYGRYSTGRAFHLVMSFMRGPGSQHISEASLGL